MKHKKTTTIVLIVFLVLCVSVLIYIAKSHQNTGSSVSKSVDISRVAPQKNYVLEEFPIETVPLYKMKMVSSSKFFVNKEPTRYADYFGKVVNYYNVVFETEATPKEYLQYYRSLMSEVNDDSVSDSQVEGKIGKYKIQASHHGDNPKNYGYLQVYMPSDEYQETNRYFQDYPDVVELDASFSEYESSYGLLNQKGGEVEYTQYFPLPKEENAQNNLIKKYKEKYSKEEGYSFNEETGLMIWKNNIYNATVYVTFSKDHGRLYLMMRRPM